MPEAKFIHCPYCKCERFENKETTVIVKNPSGKLTYSDLCCVNCSAKIEFSLLEDDTEFWSIRASSPEPTE